MSSRVFHRHCHSQLPTAVKGDGLYIIDKQGNAYLDAIGGAAVSCLGHSHPAIKEALSRQLDDLAYAHTQFFTTDVAEALADVLAQKAPGDLNRTYFVSGGSEAVESALKLGRQYFVERGEHQRTQFIARRQSYHGNTLGALAVGGNDWRRAPYKPLLIDSHHISPCYAYRDRGEQETVFDYGQRAANELESMIQQQGAENIIGFIAEPVVGATVGAVTAVDGYFKRIREICDQHGILLILDEVMCGIGRTGTFFAQEYDNIQADIVTVAKGLGAGYQPIGATICTDRIYNTIRDGSGFFQHGHTYMAHSLSMAAALAVVKTIDEEQLLTQVSQRGQQLHERLSDRLGDNSFVGDIRGRGLFLGLELVADKTTKAPLPVDTSLPGKIRLTAMDMGLLIYPMSGTIDGVNGHHILLAPPYTVTIEALDELVDKLALSLEKVLPAQVSL